VEDTLLNEAASAAAYSGSLARARDLRRRAASSAQHSDESQTAAVYETEAALTEALFGNVSEARPRHSQFRPRAMSSFEQHWRWHSLAILRRRSAWPVI
jgi:hypothetical protein